MKEYFKESNEGSVAKSGYAITLKLRGKELGKDKSGAKKFEEKDLSFTCPFKPQTIVITKLENLKEVKKND